MSHIVINWSALLRAATASLVVGVAMIAVFTVAVLGYARAENPDSSPLARRSGVVQAGLALAVCAGATAYGVYLLVPAFH